MTDFEAKLADFCQTVLRPGHVVVDVGAHLGRHTIPFARRVGPRGKVIAFEPIPEINRQLQEALRAEALKSPLAPIRLYDVALGPERAQTTFVVVDDFPEYSGLRERVYDNEPNAQRREIPIQVEVLDDFLQDEARVDLIKVDTEGGEYGVLQGSTRTMERHRPIVTFECGDNSLINYDHTAADLFDLFDGTGYRVVDINQRPLGRSAFIESSARQDVWDYLAFPLEWEGPTAPDLAARAQAALRSTIAGAKRRLRDRR